MDDPIDMFGRQFEDGLRRNTWSTGKQSQDTSNQASSVKELADEGGKNTEKINERNQGKKKLKWRKISDNEEEGDLAKKGYFPPFIGPELRFGQSYRYDWEVV